MTAVCALAALLAQPSLSGQAVLARVQQAYDAVESFAQVATSTVGSRAASAQIYFQRPGRLAVRGVTIFGRNYALLSDGTSTTVYISNRWTTVRNLDMGFAAIAGSSGNSGSGVPCALTHSTWDDLLHPPRPASVHIEGQFYRVTYPVDTTLWVDRRSFLIAKSRTNVAGSVTTVTYRPPAVNKPVPASVFRR